MIADTGNFFLKDSIVASFLCFTRKFHSSASIALYLFVLVFFISSSGGFGIQNPLLTKSIFVCDVFDILLTCFKKLYLSSSLFSVII